MEKLQPVIKQMFWIVFGLAIILVTVGWWKASGDLSTQISARRSAVETAFGDAKKSVAAVPNSRWTEGAREINALHQDDYRRSARGLYARQLNARTFPKQIEDQLNSFEFNRPINNKALREQYAKLYPTYFQRQLAVIRPFKLGEGVVDVTGASITQEDYYRWETQRPTSTEIWKAQEDIWLLRSIFDTIAAINDGFDRIDQAPLRSLMTLKLRGGSRNAPVGGGDGGGAVPGAAGSFMIRRYDQEDDRSTSGGGGGAGAQRTGKASWTKFEGSLNNDLLTEEFGSGRATVAAAAASTEESQYDFDDDDDRGRRGRSEAPPSEEIRYVDDEPDLPYKTRAFLLKVKVLQEDVPRVLAELTNSHFPVEIVRVDASFAGAPSVSAGQNSRGRRGGGRDKEDGRAGFGGSRRGSVSLPAGAAGGGFGGFAAGGREGGRSRRGGRSDERAFGGRGGQRALPLTAAQRKMVEQGERFKAAGLADTRLCTLRVCGLMTLYRTTEENSAEIETEKAAEIEDQDVGGVEVQAPEDEIPVNRPEEETDGMPQDADAASEAEPGLDPADTLDEGSPADGADSGDDPFAGTEANEAAETSSSGTDEGSENSQPGETTP